jgi:hypothetical protein
MKVLWDLYLTTYMVLVSLKCIQMVEQFQHSEQLHMCCRNPTLVKCGGEAQHLEKLEVGSLPGLPNVQSSTARGKTPRIGVFLVSLERS